MRALVSVLVFSACETGVVDLVPPDAGALRRDGMTAPDAEVAPFDAGPLDAGDVSAPTGCAVVEGTSAIVLSADEGSSTTRVSPVPQMTYTRVVAIAADGAIWAVSRGELLLSTDEGCHFASVASVRAFKVRQGPDDALYFFDLHSLDHVRVRGRSIEHVSAAGPRYDPFSPFVAHAVDRTNPARIRVVVGNGEILTSEDGGETFVTTAIVDVDGRSAALSASISPRDIDEIVVSLAPGIARTIDGGQTWVRGDSAGAAIDLEHSALDPDLVWAHGIDRVRELWLSIDAGRSFEPVVSSARLGSWFGLVPSPHDRNVVYLADRAALRRYDRATGELRSMLPNAQVGAVAVDPRDPRRLIIGLENPGP